MPVITWKFKGEPFEGTPEVSAEGNRHISTIQLTDIEDSEDKGEYRSANQLSYYKAEFVLRLTLSGSMPMLYSE